MKKTKNIYMYLLLIAILGIATIIGCSDPGSDPAGAEGPITPTVISTSPLDAATIVAVNSTVTATFSEAMDAATITATTFTVENTTTSTPVEGVVTYDAVTKTASFAPNVLLIGSSTVYTATITTGAKSAGGVALAANKVFSFTTTDVGLGPLPVLLGTSGNYVILAESAVSNTGTSAITGNIGLSPAATSFVTGLSLINITGAALSAQVTGVIYAADMAAPTPANLTAAVDAMLSAYTDAAGRTTPDFTDTGAGNLGGLTLTGGLYKFTTAVTIPTNVTLSGAANDVFIFQIPGSLTVGDAVQVILSGGVQAKNVFWQVASGATLGTTSQFQGIILSATAITINTGATLNGRALAQTAVSMSGNTLVQP